MSGSQSPSPVPGAVDDPRDRREEEDDALEEEGPHLDDVAQEQAAELEEGEVDPADFMEEDSKLRNVIPRNLRFKEDPGLYEDKLHPVNREYRGKDQPHPFVPNMKEWRSGQRHPVELAPCVLTITHGSNPNAAMSFGGLAGQADVKFVRYTPRLDSQYPCHELSWFYVTPEEEKEEQRKNKGKPPAYNQKELDARRKISWLVFPNSIRHGISPNGEKGCLKQHLGVGGTVQHERVPPALKAYADRNELAQISFELFSEHEESPGYGPTIGKPCIAGISHAEIEDLCARFRTSKGQLYVTKEQRLLMTLWKPQGCSISIFREVLDATLGTKQYQRMLDYLGLIMSKTAANGFFWHYTAQSALALDDPQFPFKAVKPPRWMIKQWIVDLEKLENGKLKATKALPVKWGQFGRPRVWPDIATQTFAHRLSVARQATSLTQTIQASLDQQAGDIKILFRRDTRDHRRYVGDIYAVVSGPPGTKDSMRVEPGTRVRITSSTFSVKGVIVPDFSSSHAWAVVYVFSPNRRLDYVSLNASIELEDNPTSFERHDRALVHMRTPLERKEGMDLHTVIYQQPPVIPTTARDPWAATLSPEQKAAFFEMYQQFKPNEKQMLFARQFCESGQGFLVLWGPPGTGKSHTLAALVFCYMVTNKMYRKEKRWNVLMGAPSNEAAEGLLNELVKVKDEFLTGDLMSNVSLELVHFKGAANDDLKTQNEPARWSKDQILKSQGDSNTTDTTVEPEDDYDDELRDQLSIYEVLEAKFGLSKEIHSNFAFAHARLQAITRYIRDKKHPMHDLAITYNRLRNKLIDGYGPDPTKHLSKQERDSKVHMKKEMELDLGGYYLNHDVDCVVGTYNRCFHEMLRQSYFADLVIGDECPLASTPNFLTLLASQKDTATHGIAAGDHKQQQDVAMARDRNEFFDMSNMSMFQRLVEDPNPEAFTTVTLNTQYRMHPECAQTVNELWYDGKLVNHESTTGDSDDWVTTRDFLRRFGAAYNDRRVLGIDCSGPENKSAQFSTGTSLKNDSEVAIIIELIHGMINHQPPAGGRRLEPRDFLVLPFYQGQEYVFNQKFIRAFGGDDPTEKYPVNNRVHVNTVGGVQGRQGLIVIISFTKNDPINPGAVRFIANKQALNVALSRQKHCRIMVGALETWLQQLREGSRRLLNRNSKEYVFGRVISELFPRGGECRIIANSDFRKGMDGLEVKTPALPSSLMDLKRKRGEN